MYLTYIKDRIYGRIQNNISSDRFFNQVKRHVRDQVYSQLSNQSLIQLKRQIGRQLVDDIHGH